MAHHEQQQFIQRMKERYPGKFQNCDVLDVGSLDINGNNRGFFTNCKNYTGMDIGEGRNVDVVSLAHEYHPSKQFDVVISTEMLEHDPHWVESVMNMIELTKKGGLLIISCATYGRPEHGTSERSPVDSPLTINKGWGNYYLNIGVAEFENIILPYSWNPFIVELDNSHHDLYFFGIKR